MYAELTLGHVCVLKADVSDGFYRICLRPSDIPKLDLFLPTREDEEHLVVIPLILPMGWNNPSPIFCTSMETVSNLENSAIRSHIRARPHPPE